MATNEYLKAMDAASAAREEAQRAWSAEGIAQRAEEVRQLELDAREAAKRQAQLCAIEAVNLQRDALKRLRWSYLQPESLNDVVQILSRAVALVASAALIADQERAIATGALPASAVRGKPPRYDVIVVRRLRKEKKRAKRVS